MKTQDWFDQITPIIVREAFNRGYNFPSAIIAQAHVESWKGLTNGGKPSGLASNYNNFFGMKCGKSWKGKSVNLKTKEEYTVGTLTEIKDNFRAYDSIEEGIIGYFNFINCPRYQNLKTAKSAEEYFALLKKDGWATSSTYVNTLTNRHRTLGLSKYDGSGSVPQNGFTIGVTYTTNTDLYIRDEANGSKVKFTDITKDAQKHGKEDANGFAILKKGTRVTCKGVKKILLSVWIKIPSGWICAKSGLGKNYIQ